LFAFKFENLEVLLILFELDKQKVTYQKKVTRKKNKTKTKKIKKKQSKKVDAEVLPSSRAESFFRKL
jgi:hypothetical protein